MVKRISVALVSCALAASALLAADQTQKTPELTAKQQAEMAAMMKAATPGDAHKKLSAMVGDFDVKVTLWMAPGAPPNVSTGKSHNVWVLGNRWVQQTFDGTFLGQPFHGIGYTGYNNIQQKYVGTWIDDTTTAMMTSTGSAGADGKYTFDATMDDPVTGKASAVKEVVTVADNDHHMLEMWGAGEDGKQYKMMEIAYTRVK